MNTIINQSHFNVFLKPFLFLAFLFLGEITATEIVLLYALETIIAGLFHLVKLFFVSFLTDKTTAQKFLGVFYMGFFSLHYGIFVFVQTTFFFVFLSMEDPNISSSIGFENFRTILQMHGFQVGLAFMLISYVLRFYFVFFRTGYYKTVQLEAYIFQPYLRIFIQQFVAIIPGFFIIFGKAGFMAAVLLIIIRGVTDYYLNRMRSDEKYFNIAFNYLFKKQISEGLSDKNRAEAEGFLKMMVNE